MIEGTEAVDVDLPPHCGDAGREPEVDPPPIRGTGTASHRNCSMAATTAREVAGPYRASPVKSVARSSRWRDLAKAAISRLMAPHDAARRLAGRSSFSEVA